jgi:hypothetical protein
MHIDTSIPTAQTAYTAQMHHTYIHTAQKDYTAQTHHTAIVQLWYSKYLSSIATVQFCNIHCTGLQHFTLQCCNGTVQLCYS